SSISNFGDWITLVAPGQNILAPKKGGGYGAVAGTSFSSPHVAGVAGLIRSANPGLTNQQVVNFIVNNVDDLGAAGKDATFGAGRVNACKALKAATNNTTVTCGAATTTQAAATATPVPTLSAQTAATATPTTAPATATATTATVAATATPVSATATPATTTKTETFTGSVAATGTAQRDHVITVAGPGTISASLGGWSGNPRNNNLDLLLLNSSGAQVAAATTTNRPEVVNFNASAAGSYTLRVVAKSGSGNYTLSVTHP
ncbi:MAG: S8 family serine peptidase, partial [Chloroflexota bacterium]